MLRDLRTCPAASRGTSLVEVLVSLVILAFGLLGIASLQAKMGAAEMESYQRAQGVLALSQMTERLTTNSAQAANYVTAGTVGTGDAEPASCAGIAPGANFDLCEWSNTLKGLSEKSGGSGVGGMVGGRGCITQLQAPNPALGVCTAGVYQVSVSWQGTVPTAANLNLACGTGLYGGNDAYRRVISATVSVPTTSCY
jgi:type IV pilus assembly protein PilV